MMSLFCRTIVNKYAGHSRLCAPYTRGRCCRVEGKQGDAKPRPWVVPPCLRAAWTYCKKGLLTGGELFLFKATCVAALLSILSCRLFVAAGVYGTALIHIEGPFEESSSMQLFFFSSTLLSCPYLHLSVNLCLVFFSSFSLSVSASVCSPHWKKSTFAFRYSISVFSTSITPAYSDAPPPLLFCSLFSHNFLLSHKPFPCLSLGFFFVLQIKTLVHIHQKLRTL